MNTTTGAPALNRQIGADLVDGPERRAGPVLALDVLFNRYAHHVLRYAASRLDASSAEDVVSETFLIAFRDLRRYDAARGEPKAWLFGIATNLIRREIHEAGRRGRLLTVVALAEFAPDDEVRMIERLDAHTRARQLSLALDALTDGDREVLLLTVMGELNASEVATVLEIPAGTVRSRLHRVRKQLRKLAPNLIDEATERVERNHA